MSMSETPINWIEQNIVILIAIFGLFPLYIDLILRLRSGRLKFSLQRFQERITEPIESEWSIRVLHPNEPIEKCKILCNDNPLQWSNNTNTENSQDTSVNVKREDNISPEDIEEIQSN